MKKKLLRLASCIITLALILSCLSSMVQVTKRKQSENKYADFFQQEEDFDVLFFGSSVVINGIFPMQLWNDHGIVSYNFGGHGNRLSTSYWVMKNALDYTNPKLVVIDCMGLKVDDRAHKVYEFLHLSLDAFPFTKTKVQAVWDLLRKDENNEAKSLRSEMIFPFSTYHSRWTELTEDDFKPEAKNNKEKGAESRISVATPIEGTTAPADAVMTESSVSMEYLERFITDCQAQGIEVLLVYLPFPPTTDCVIEAQTVPQIAEKYGVEYINFLQMGLVDFQIDCYDADSHLNPSGAQKVTEYLGNFITENYNIPDHRQDSAYAGWHTDYDEYLVHKQSLFTTSIWDAECSLSVMRDRSFDYIIQTDGGILSDPRMVTLLENIGVNIDQIPEGESYILIQKETGNIEYHTRASLENAPQGTMFGSLQVVNDGANTYLVLNGTALRTKENTQWETSNFCAYMLTEDGSCIFNEFAK